MTTEVLQTKTKQAAKLMEGFARRTGLINGQEDPSSRYLWTDAFAVNSFFGLYHITADASYRERAFRLIDLVHEYLGKYHPGDKRKGWISGLSNEKAELHPTAGGLRIGKSLPERTGSESFNEQLEWERDGQYFHYLTKWINTLYQAENESEDYRYSRWAAELLAATSAFIVNGNQDPRMYWKMDAELSQPLVSSMGAHDPLEGLICTAGIIRRFPDRKSEFDYMLSAFNRMCEGQTWITSDPLGIGGLLTDCVRAFILKKEDLHLSLDPEQLLKESIQSINNYQRNNRWEGASQRLAFRECGLSLGVRIFRGMKQKLNIPGISNAQMQCYELLANEIEDFWMDTRNQKAGTWKSHININSVTLAASLIACNHPEVFLGIPHKT
ncbi:hypothetical protein [Gramella sp. KN1008]|uniref:hypothetical protein n=1 Tax=Gramella sp. KN1008 TaxID=2529298 RepID=UPI00103ABDB7|nr:hypothetical protein [Gramella sp. KN1008]TBW28599.1 hypothetical protein EZJ28_07630 [Gramella sp. KN1008]